MTSFRRLFRQTIVVAVLSCAFSLTAFADGEMHTPVASDGEMHTPVAAPGEMHTPLSDTLLASALQTLQNMLSIV